MRVTPASPRSLSRPLTPFTSKVGPSDVHDALWRLQVVTGSSLFRRRHSAAGGLASLGGPPCFVRQLARRWAGPRTGSCRPRPPSLARHKPSSRDKEVSMATAAGRPERGVSIVCVFNDRASVGVPRPLDRSPIRAIVDVDYIPVDNRRTPVQYSAGAALNHGARRGPARSRRLRAPRRLPHSIDRLVEAGAGLLDGPWSMLGASGVTSTGEVIGLLRDRTDLIGRPAPTPVEVDTLDEVLFMIRRDVVLADPLIEESDLAWHAYAVEYATRLRRSGDRVGAVDLAITHNSLTINLDRLDVAHRVVGEHIPRLAAHPYDLRNDPGAASHLQGPPRRPGSSLEDAVDLQLCRGRGDSRGRFR